VRSGILNVRKPSGKTSFAVVRAVRGATGVEPAGHGGTLDPAADGVLPILLGRATRVADFIHEWPKTYVATVQFGATSDTYDGEGVITPSDGPLPERPAVGAALAAFSGRIRQVPPAFSALKQGGEPLYRKARRGEAVAVPPREVEIHLLRLEAHDPALGQSRLEIVCSAGTYVRSLAHDLGARLGCGAYLKALTRTAVGPLHLPDAVPLETLVKAGDAWERWLLPMDLPLRAWPALVLDADRALAVSHGRAIAAPEATGAGRHRVLDQAGRLLAWGMVDPGGTLQPRAVFPP
jgi:tRNA pseudouridine55 synthase